jgi:hypothetical protein
MVSRYAFMPCLSLLSATFTGRPIFYRDRNLEYIISLLPQTSPNCSSSRRVNNRPSSLHSTFRRDVYPFISFVTDRGSSSGNPKKLQQYIFLLFACTCALVCTGSGACRLHGESRSSRIDRCIDEIAIPRSHDLVIS